MATICGWCGKQIGFFDGAFTYEKVGDNGHYLCGQCSGRISAVQHGHGSFGAIRTEHTVPELYAHFTAAQSAGESVEEESIPEEQSYDQMMMTDAQRLSRVCEDIHQIAGDLRFIKNYLIFCIIAGVIVGFFILLSLM